MENLTQEEVQKHIAAAYDSVNSINALNGKEILTAEDEASLVRNIGHLKVMMNKDWFFTGLTTSQVNEINTLIS